MADEGCNGIDRVLILISRKSIILLVYGKKATLKCGLLFSWDNPSAVLLISPPVVLTVEERAVHIKTNHPEGAHCRDTLSVLKNVDYSLQRRKSLQARYIFGVIFLIMNLSAWFIRDYGQKVLLKGHYLKSCGVEGVDCFHTVGVLRVSLGCFIFFFSMFLSTFKTRKLYEARNAWHSRWWCLKFVLLAVSVTAPFFLPSVYVQIYGELARIGAGVFLLLQLVSVIHFIIWWNKYWKADQQRKQSCCLGLFMSTLFYILSVCGVVLMYILYTSRSSCALNIFFISWTAILLLVMMITSLHPMVNRGLLSSGIMACYVVFLCWCAIRSEPATAKCIHKQNQEKENHDWTTVVSFLLAIFAVVMATFSTGIDSECFQFRREKSQQEDDVPYRYGFFHMIFSLGTMHFAMLFISWNLNNSAKKWSIDVGWASTWVKIVNEWFAATIYIWKLIAPVVRQNKVTDHNEPVVGTVTLVLT